MCRGPRPTAPGKSHGVNVVINWIDVMVAREQRKDQLARARRERLLRHVQASGPPARVRYRRWMAHLGDRLVAWGQLLRSRYADTPIAWPVGSECRWMDGDSGRCLC